MPKQELLGEVKKLINLGKEKGFLTYDDLNSTLPADVVSSDQFSTIMTMFGEMDIEIVESAETERAPKAVEGEEAIEESEEAEAAEENEKEIDLTPGALSRTDDPVRLYLKEMGSVALLSREGEIEIAKRIEEGKKDIASVVYGLPMTLEFVLNLRDQLKNGKIDVREIVPVVETEEDFEEELHEDRIAMVANTKMTKRIKSTYRRVVMAMDAGGTSVDIDTDKPVTDSVTDLPVNPMNMMGNMFQAMIGKSFLMKVDAEGKVTEVSGLKEMADAMIASMNLNEEMKPMIQRLFSAQFNEENLKQTFSQSFNIFPNKAVKVGDTWDKTIVVPGMVATTMNSTYTVKSITADNVTLGITSTIEVGNTKGTQTGTLIVDPRTGLVTDGDMVQKFEEKVTSRIKITGKEK